AVNRLILTASGGPFYGYSYEQLKSVTVEQALKHPNWSMGHKITIDSATMMNKGLEIIEAKWLFDMPIDKIDVVVHRESIVHSMVEYTDNSVIAQLGVPDMKIPIQYALTYPQRMNCHVEKLDLTKVGSLTFMQPDYDTFKCLNACKRSMKLGGTAPVLANGANEAAVQMFLDKKISFTDIGDIVWGAITKLPIEDIINVDSIIKADKAAREYAVSYSA
ncbi:MAG: 1-deoxy-D-xylulose-5-phosphate reductoisomerase, partial [Clostridia bacterium]|nr:1-deoxy-D-xylulose-5-phosphate reductoisomerase [Clostridia bacterium]